MPKTGAAAGRWSRRDFLKASAHTGILLTLGRPLFSTSVEGWETASGRPLDLAVVRGNPQEAVRKAIDLFGGITHFVQKGQRVLIKPNMSFAKTPEEGANTHPLLVAAVAQSCIEAGAQTVLVADHTLHKAELCLELSGIRKSCASIPRTHVLALNDEKFYQAVSIPQGKVVKELKVMKEVLRSDVIINLPTAKSHSATGVSLGMKGLMGLIWNREYFHSQVDLHQAIADLSTLVKPALTIIDASRVLITGGPSGPGKVETLDTIIAGVDPVAVDSYGVTIARWFNRQFEPAQVKHLVAAHTMGLGNINLNQLTIREEKV